MRINKNNSLCFTGHRTEKLPKTEKELENLKKKLLLAIDRAIANGVDTFYFGACYGFDLLAAQLVLMRSKILVLDNPKHIRLIAVVPFEEQAACWSETNREIYYSTLQYCDEVIMLHTKFEKGCYHERNRYMVNRAGQMIAYYDGSSGGTGYTVQYAKQKGIKITNLY